MIFFFYGCFFVLIALILLIVYWYFSIPKNLPPGPLGMPFIGTLFLGTNSHKRLADFKEIYGPVVSFYIFDQLVVSLNDEDSFREVLVKQGDKVKDRPQSYMALRDAKGNYGLITSNGQLWQEQRRFALATLRDFGFGKPIMERGIMEEVQKFLEALQESTNKPFDMQYLLNNAVSNVICQVVFGRRFEYDDRAFFDVLHRLNNRVSFVDLPRMLSMDFLVRNILSFLPFYKTRIDLALQNGEKMREYLQQVIDENKKTFDFNKEPENFVHAFLKKRMEPETNLGSGMSFVDHQLLMAVTSLFAAGTETTSTTLRWAILYCIRHADIQEKVHEEIVSVVGTDRVPSMTDKIDLPYTEAVLLETQRIAALVSITLRKTLAPISYKHFVIPAKTVVMENIWAVHNNRHTFRNPQIFNPLRFLNAEQNKVVRSEKIFPFGAGKRKCLGESLAKMELFLFFSSMMQRFRFQSAPGKPPPSEKAIWGITRQPLPHEVLVTSRLN